MLLFLTFEGWVYFALALLELLSHILPAVRDNLNVFKDIDIVLGALSSFPLFLYYLFLCFFTITKLLDGVPHWLRRFGTFTLLLLIPVILALNEVASFIGVTHRTINSSTAIGFSSAHDKTLWTFFTDFDIGFVAGYQAFHFSFAFFRLTKAFLEQERIESTNADEALLFKGTGWIAFGIKLGAVESVIGFVQPHFGVVLARRIIRTLARASLTIGVFKGLDVSEDFQQVREEILTGNRNRSFRGSRLRPLISDPRLSTFRQLSPGATQAVFNNFREKDPPRTAASVPMTPGQRVTVHLDAGRAPTLNLRFSAFDMPSPAEIVESVKSRPASEWMSTAPSRRSSYYANSTMTRHTIAMSEVPPLPGGPETESTLQPIHNAFTHTRDVSNITADSGFRDSVNSLSYSDVRNLASQFPGLPPRVTSASQKAQLRTAQISSQQSSKDLTTLSQSSLTKTPSLSTSNSLRRKPAPRASLVLAPTSIDPFGDEETQTGVRLPTPLGASEHAHQMSIALSTAATTAGSLFTRPQSSSQPTSGYFTTPTTGQTEDPFKYDAQRRIAGRSRSSAVPSELPSVMESNGTPRARHNRGKSMESLDIAWLQRPESEEYDVGYSEEATIVRAIRGKISGPTSLPKRRSRSAPRIKSIGKAPRKYTPSPTHTSYTRESIYIEPIVIPPRQYGYPNVELEQGTLNGSVLNQSLRDSNILGQG
ncbi:hypothetical protein GYMLUDRAFT_244896 [Collybiopsis luxurians FD-317 M1]|uniref:Uncharacterized protein n=1 Tax=Collybiopsis luxurians FD-317 M1 TaxID=944289 RepID=A0A0D0B813_9AGAR|nr:hypothetical protein GYMLUDRAFT_244896 [Collybiopsis luxurians FD-317 M1]